MRNRLFQGNACYSGSCYDLKSNMTHFKEANTQFKMQTKDPVLCLLFSRDYTIFKVMGSFLH